MSRGRIALLVLAALVLALVLLRGPIALRVMDRALARNLAADPFAALPDGLHVLLCGAGGPLPDPVRSGPCTAVIAGRTLVVVDLIVTGRAQRRGVGRALMEAAAARCRAGGGKALTWWVRESNRGAIAFYGSLGARVYGATAPVPMHLRV